MESGSFRNKALGMQRFAYFDLGNVLVTFDHEIAVRQLADLADCSPQAARAVVFESGLQLRFETGLIDNLGFASEVNRQLGTQLAVNDILTAISHIFEPNPPILAALEKLSSAGIPLGILSNTCQPHWHWLQSQNWPMMDASWFQHAILSYEVQSMKPDARIYEASENQAGCTANQIFFADDRPENVAAAAQRGWATYQFGTVDGLLEHVDLWLGTPSLR